MTILRVWGSGPDDVYATGNGMVVHYDGKAWTEVEVGMKDTFSGVWGSSPGDVFVLGSMGTVLRAGRE